MFRFAVLLCCLVLLPVPATTAGPLPLLVPAALKRRMGTPPPQVLEGILRHNQGETTATASNPQVTWLAGCDPRLDSRLLTEQAAGRIYQIHTPAALFALATPAVDYGVRDLYTPLLLITLATDDPFLAASQARSQPEEPERRRILQLVGRATQGADDGTGGLLALLHQQVVQACQRYGDRVASGRLAVVGGVLDLDGRFGHGAGRLYIVEVNGENRREQLLRSPLLTTLAHRFAHRIGLPAVEQTDTGGAGRQTDALPKDQRREEGKELPAAGKVQEAR